MKKSTAHHSTTPLANDGIKTSGTDTGELRLLATLADTTWRIAVPVVLGAGIGIFADVNLGTKPWLTLLGTVIGFVGAGVLLKQQLDAATRAGGDNE